MSLSERKRELRRRRHRKQKLAKIRVRAQKASAAEKAVLAQKLRDLTPGAAGVIAELKLV